MAPLKAPLKTQEAIILTGSPLLSCLPAFIKSLQEKYDVRAFFNQQGSFQLLCPGVESTETTSQRDWKLQEGDKSLPVKGVVRLCDLTNIRHEMADLEQTLDVCKSLSNSYVFMCIFLVTKPEESILAKAIEAKLTILRKESVQDTSRFEKRKGIPVRFTNLFVFSEFEDRLGSILSSACLHVLSSPQRCAIARLTLSSSEDLARKPPLALPARSCELQKHPEDSRDCFIESQNLAFFGQSKPYLFISGALRGRAFIPATVKELQRKYEIMADCQIVTSLRPYCPNILPFNPITSPGIESRFAGVIHICGTSNVESEVRLLETNSSRTIWRARDMSFICISVISNPEENIVAKAVAAKLLSMSAPTQISPEMGVTRYTHLIVLGENNLDLGPVLSSTCFHILSARSIISKLSISTIRDKPGYWLHGQKIPEERRQNPVMNFLTKFARVMKVILYKIWWWWSTIFGFAVLWTIIWDNVQQYKMRILMEHYSGGKPPYPPNWSRDHESPTWEHRGSK